MTYTELKDKQQENLTELSHKVGLFWAFSKDQFKRGMEQYPAKKYTSIGMGGYLPSENVDKYIEGMEQLDKWFKKEVKKVKKEQAILYELNNYECFYTGSIEDAYDVLKGIYTEEEVREVYRTHARHAKC